MASSSRLLSSGDTFAYDANGNMTTRVEGGVTYTQNFDIENRLTSVTVNSQTTTFVYDGDGNLVRKIKPDGTSTAYVGGVYEVELNAGGQITKKTSYYGVAMRVEVVGVSNTLYFVLRDHLGSASVTLDASGNVVANGEQRYYPFGESRIAGASLPTDRLYTGQRDTGLGLYHYGARFYSSALGRFISADSIVPNWTNPQSLNRYAYVLNSPMRYTDPTGHVCVNAESGDFAMAGDCDGGANPRPQSSWLGGGGIGGGHSGSGGGGGSEGGGGESGDRGEGGNGDGGNSGNGNGSSGGGGSEGFGNICSDLVGWIPSYSTTCSNLDMGITILTHPRETFRQPGGVRAYTLAAAYTTGEFLGHGILLVYVPEIVVEMLGGGLADRREPTGFWPDPTQPPDPEFWGDSWEWRPPGDSPGTGRGAWFNPDSGESLRPDFNNPAHDPHYDYDWRGNPDDGWRIYEDHWEPK